MPKPNPGENKDDFMSRCMGNATMNSDFPDNGQRYAVCQKQFSQKAAMAKRDVKIYVPFAKSDDEARMVYGYCTSEALDSQGEVVTKAAIQKAWEAYMEYGNIREMHQASAVGVTKEYSHDDNGTWIGVKVVDDRAWKFVKEGVYKGFSIGGRVLKRHKNVISEILLAEISLVDRPANPDAKFDSYKMDGELVESIASGEINLATIMHKYVEFEGVKYQEDPEKPGEALLDEKGERVLYVEEESAEEGAPTPEEAPAEAAPEEAPAPEAAPEAAPEPEAEPAPEAAPEEPKEKALGIEGLTKVKSPAKKDTMGVVTLASLLDHVDFLEEMFEMNGKDTAELNNVREEIKSLIATEAGEPDKEEEMEMAAKPGDLAKTLGAELAKAMEPFMAKVDAIAADLEKVKNTKVSPRPKGSVAVEKSVVVPGESPATLVAKRKELDEVSKEIDAFADKAKTASASEGEALMRRSAELLTKFRTLQREVRDLEATQLGA